MVTVIFSILEVDGCGFGGWRTFGGKNDALLSLVMLWCMQLQLPVHTVQQQQQQLGNHGDRRAPPSTTGSNVLVGLANQHHIVHPSPSNKGLTLQTDA